MCRETRCRIGVCPRMMARAARRSAVSSCRRGMADGSRSARRTRLVLSGERPVEAPRRLARHLAPVALDGPEERRHPLHRLRRRARVREIVEEPEERAGRPFRRQSQQVEEVPYLDRMDLHRGRRQQHKTVSARP